MKAAIVLGPTPGIERSLFSGEEGSLKDKISLIFSSISLILSSKDWIWSMRILKAIPLTSEALPEYIDSLATEISFPARSEE